ncbi:VOC family protein [Saccharopolyspora phatthalungensis]|uniref:Putative glyoxalase superfamily protein PhnB n=1 Tax=Saccharopolyspora phatthalungensis TaxID=664693 RepID=A0A840QHA7_9PSEU|nr:VOC family protein [Saccharopolyspora phatthalungensis]MBB5158158.1 putative glyoxalase superfamily protein PhnB [Saccharopolyspora phatthalungensis]
MTTNAPHTGIWPLIPYADKKAGIRFLVEAFGFEESLIVPGDDGGIVHAELRWPNGGGIMIGTCDTGNPFAKPKGSGAAYVVTGEPDALFERAVAAGAEVLRKPQDQDYGSREFAVRDPEGNTWSFGTYAGS